MVRLAGAEAYCIATRTACCNKYGTDHDVVMWMQYGRTECIRDTRDPDFVTKFDVNYYFQESQKLKFDL